ncbi:hypothetical protein [Gracilibacillus xinjiangensis]|uniref:DUF4129 domain-containing protein n=1 Tax=Gracilibacillus xinjiangensis TaxID=1193282 RepID=A0ABV8X0S0_9BACI
MQAKGRSVFSIFLQGILEFLSFFPFILLIGTLTIEGNIYYWLIGLYGLFCLSAAIRSYLKQRTIVIILAAFLAFGFTFIIGSDILSYLSSFISGFIASYRGVQYAESNGKELLPSRILWGIGLPSYFVGYILFSNFDSLIDYIGFLSSIGLVFIITMLIVTNQAHLQKESLTKEKKHHTSREMKRINYAYLLFTIVFVFLLTNFQVIQSFLYHSVRSVIQAIVSFVELFSNEEPPMEELPQQNNQPMLPTEEFSEPSRFAEIMEQVTIIFGILLVILAAILMLSLLFKKVRRLVKKVILFIWNALKQVFTTSRFNQLDSEYMDEKENLFNWKNWRNEKQTEIKDRLQSIFGRKTKYDQLSTEDKVRFLYREITRELRKQDKWKESMTAHEVLDISGQELDSLEEMYDHVRYGQELLGHSSDSDLRSIWNKLQNK